MGIWFFSSLCGGMLSVLSFCRPDQVAWKFVRLIGVLALAMLAGSSAWCLSAHPGGESLLPSYGVVLMLIAAVLAGVLIGLAPYLPTRRKLFVAVIAPAAACALAASCIWAIVHDEIVIGSFGQWAMLVAGQLTGALLMGAVTIAWLLGHAYLTATKMTIAPLLRFSRILMVVLAARLLLSVGAITAAMAGGGAGASEVARHWMLLSLRGGVGLLLPAMFAYMVYDCVKLRSTQSATGILYFASPFIYVGELCSLIALGELGWPV